MGRRAVVATILVGGGATVAAAVTGGRRGAGPRRDAGSGGPSGSASAGRLAARPQAPAEPAPAPGLHPLQLAGGRDGLLVVPAAHRPDVAAPLVVTLHGAGGDATGAVGFWRELADASGLVLLAPESRGATWDVIQGGYGPDVAFLDRALARVFSSIAVDPRRMAITGFSDGASYALSLGLANGDLFSHGVGFSPGFVAEPGRHGRPRAFVTHGVHDRVLPIDRCSRRIVPALRRDGYDVDYREFDGGHEVPPDLVRAAVAWMAAG